MGSSGWLEIQTGKDGGCPEWWGGSSARGILKETNSCSFLEFYPGELSYTEPDFPPLIPRSFPVIFSNFLNDFNERGRVRIPLPPPLTY